MLQVRFHGRGGQGVVSAGEMLSIAAFEEGACAQAFPSFGSERTGAPVLAFCRIAEREIRTHEPISHPDAVVIADPTLLHQVDVFGGLAEGGYVLINSSRTLPELGLGELAERLGERAIAVPATGIAREELGRPLPNAVLLGALAAQTGVVSIGSVAAAIRRKFAGETAEANVRGAERAFSLVDGLKAGRVGAVTDA